MTELKTILIAIDKLPQSIIEKVIKPYIDTPGDYIAEKKDYNSVSEYYRLNMGSSDFNKLLTWIDNHPKESAKLIKLAKKKRK